MNYFEKFKQIFTEAANDSDGLKEGGSIRNEEITLRASIDLASGVFIFDTSGFNSFTLTAENSGLASKLIIQSSNNPSVGVQWSPLHGNPLHGVPSFLSLSNGFVNYSPTTYSFGKSGRFVKVSQGNSGAPTIVTIVLSTAQAYIPQKDYKLSKEFSWRFLSGSAITDGTALRISPSPTANPALVRSLAMIRLVNSGSETATAILFYGISAGSANAGNTFDRIKIPSGGEKNIEYPALMFSDSGTDIWIQLTSFANASLDVFACGFTSHSA